MLAIPMRFPVKRMAIYGSSALLIGFVTTAALLREFAPKDRFTGVSYVQPVIRDTSTAESGQADESAAADHSEATSLPDQGSIVMQGGVSMPQRYSVVTPTATSPVASTGSFTAPTAIPAEATSSANPNPPVVSQPIEQPEPTAVVPIDVPLEPLTDTINTIETVVIESVQ